MTTPSYRSGYWCAECQRDITDKREIYVGEYGIIECVGCVVARRNAAMAQMVLAAIEKDAGIRDQLKALLGLTG